MLEWAKNCIVIVLCPIMVAVVGGVLLWNWLDVPDMPKPAPLTPDRPTIPERIKRVREFVRLIRVILKAVSDEPLSNKPAIFKPNQCRSWGNSGSPSDLKPEIKKYPVGSTSQIKSWDDVKKALSQGYGIAVCSDQGFTMQRDSEGKCRPSGSWAHCMCIDGYHTDEQGREWGHIENSWGANAHTGPVGWGNPNTAGFWTDSGTINRMVGQGDTWAFSVVKGFPSSKPLDWVGIKKPIAQPKRVKNIFDIFALAY